MDAKAVPSKGQHVVRIPPPVAVSAFNSDIVEEVHLDGDRTLTPASPARAFRIEAEERSGSAGCSSEDPPDFVEHAEERGGITTTGPPQGCLIDDAGVGVVAEEHLVHQRALAGSGHAAHQHPLRNVDVDRPEILSAGSAEGPSILPEPPGSAGGRR